MKLAFTTLGCPDWDLARIIAVARDNGYDGVDFRGYLREMAIYRLPEFSTQVRGTVNLFAEAHLQVSCLSSGARLFEADPGKRAAHLAEIDAYTELAGHFGVKFIRVFGGPLNGTGAEEAVSVAAEALERMARAAAPVCVVVETHDDWVDSALMSRLMRRVAGPNVGVLWDLNHPYRLNRETPEQTLANIGRFVRYLHVKDSIATGDGGHQYVLPGEGDVPISRMIGLLRSAGYDGWVTVEWEKLWHEELTEPQIALPAYAEHLRKMI